MNPDFPTDPRQALEVSLTALLLGELPADQARFLRQAIAMDPELARLHQRLKKTIELVREVEKQPAPSAEEGSTGSAGALAGESGNAPGVGAKKDDAKQGQDETKGTAPAKSPELLRLSEERRGKLLSEFKTIRPRQFAKGEKRKMSWLVPAAAAVVLVMLLGSMLLPAFSKAKMKAMRYRTWSLGSEGGEPESSVALSVPAPAAKAAAETAVNEAVMRQAPEIAARAAEVLRAPVTTSPGKVEGAAKKLPEIAIVLPKDGDEQGAFRRRYGLSATEPQSAARRFQAGTDYGGFATTQVPPSKGTEFAAGDTRLGYYYADKEQLNRGVADPARQSGNENSLATFGGAGTGGGGIGGGLLTVPRANVAGGAYLGGAMGGGIASRGGGPTRPPEAQTAVTPPPGQMADSSAIASVDPSTGFPIAPAVDPNAGLPVASTPTTELPQPHAYARSTEIAGLPQGRFATKPPTKAANGIELPPDARVPILGDKPLVGKDFAGRARSEDAVIDFVPQKTAQAASESPKAGDTVNAGKLRLSFDDKMHTKQGIVALDEGAVQQFGRARLQEALKNSGEGKFSSVPAQQPSAAAGKEADKSPPELAQALADLRNSDLSEAEKAERYKILNADGERQYQESLKQRDAASRERLVNIEKAWAMPPKRELLPQPQAAGTQEKSRVLTESGRQQDLEVGKDTEAKQKVDALASAGRAEVRAKIEERVSSTNIPAATPQGQSSSNLHLTGITTIVGGKVDLLKEPPALGITPPDNAKGSATSSLSSTYAEKKLELEELQKVREILLAKEFSERTDLDLPKTPSVEIVDKAAAESSEKPGLLSSLGRKLLASNVERKARVKVERDQGDISGLNTPQGTPYDPYFIQSEAEAIQSEDVLGKVVDELKLEESLGKGRGKAEAIRRLKTMLDVRPESGSQVVDIGVKSATPEEAARIANALAETYRGYRTEQRLTRGGIDVVTARQKKIETRVAQLQQELTVLGSQKASEADAAPKRVPPAGAPIPQPEVQTAENPFSTFSLNVSDVSFKLAAASLEKGALPDPTGIRSEEFINAFDYRDPEPAPGAPLAFAWERARYPFAQNRDLLRLSIKTAASGRQAGRPLNLVLLLDNSGSMERADRVRIIHEALRVLAGQLQPQDKLSVVVFARTAHLWVDGISAKDAQVVADQLSGLTPDGGTNLEDAMNVAYQTAARHYLANGINRVVLLTDGAANLGDVNPEALKQKVETNRKQGIALDCFGIGWEGYNDDLLEVLSRNGDGRYGFINTPEEAATEFAGQLAGALQVAASDVKVQVEFNPNRVTAYRQIGYAKHQLTKEQFRDNTVDAAEIGAAETGNALYVIETNPRGQGPVAMVRVRYKVPGTSDYREHEWPVPYTGGAVALEQASAAMRLAAVASGFSEWLAVSPYAAEVTADALLGYLAGIPETCGADKRPQKLEWMIRQAKSLQGK